MGVSSVQPDRRAAHILRLRRIEGQVKGLQRMIDEDQSCLDVLTQLSAITHALNAFGMELVGDHVRGCLNLAAARAGHAPDGPAPDGRAPDAHTPAPDAPDVDALAAQIITALSRLARA